MSLTLSQIARLVDGWLTGSGELEIRGAATLAAARPGEITLCDSPKLAPQLARSQAAAAIVPLGLSHAGLPTVEVADVHAAFAQIVGAFRPLRAPRPVGIHPQAVVSLSARIGPGGSKPDLWSASLSWDDGPWNLSLAHEEHRGYQGPGRTDTATKLGAAYRVGPARLAGAIHAVNIKGNLTYAL